MRLLEEHVGKYGNALNENVLKVDTFLNHQIDAQLMMELARGFKEHFEDRHITKIAIIKTSGITPAVVLGYLLQVPVVYFKRDTSRIMRDGLCTCQIHSFAKDRDYDIIYSKKYLFANDHVPFLDDFMVGDEACLGGIEVLRQVDAVIESIGTIVERIFQRGRLKIEAQRCPVYSRARIASLSQGMIAFVSEEYGIAQASIVHNPDTVRFSSASGIPHTPIRSDYEIVSFY